MTARYEFIDSHAVKNAYPVVKMCACLGVSTSGYYDWRSRPASATARRRDELAVLIRKPHSLVDSPFKRRRVGVFLTSKEAGLIGVRPS